MSDYHEFCAWKLRDKLPNLQHQILTRISELADEDGRIRIPCSEIIKPIKAISKNKMMAFIQLSEAGYITMQAKDKHTWHWRKGEKPYFFVIHYPKVANAIEHENSIRRKNRLVREGLVEAIEILKAFPKDQEELEEKWAKLLAIAERLSVRARPPHEYRHDYRKIVDPGLGKEGSVPRDYQGLPGGATDSFGVRKTI